MFVYRWGRAELLMVVSCLISSTAPRLPGFRLMGTEFALIMSRRLAGLVGNLANTVLRALPYPQRRPGVTRWNTQGGYGSLLVLPLTLFKGRFRST